MTTHQQALRAALEAMQRACDQDRDMYVDFGVAMTMCRESLKIEPEMALLQSKLAEPEKQTPMTDSRYSDIVSDGGVDPRNTSLDKEELNRLALGHLAR